MPHVAFTIVFSTGSIIRALFSCLPMINIIQADLFVCRPGMHVQYCNCSLSTMGVCRCTFQTVRQSLSIQQQRGWHGHCQQENVGELCQWLQGLRKPLSAVCFLGCLGRVTCTWWLSQDLQTTVLVQGLLWTVVFVWKLYICWVKHKKRNLDRPKDVPEDSLLGNKL